MSVEIILLIGVLTIDAIALGADYLWSLIIKSFLSNRSNSSLEADFANHFLEISMNVQKQTARFLIIILLVVLAGATALNLVPNSRLEPYLLKIGLIGLIVALSLIFVEFAQVNQSIANKPIIINIFVGIRLIAEVVAYWSFLHYALNPKV